MKILGLSIFIIACLIVINRDWIKYMWTEHICGPYNENEPPFCFECNYSNCGDCDALKAYRINPEQGWRVWEDMNKRRNMKF